MYGHIPQYLDAEKQRLRAERAEEQVRRWRVTAWMLLVLLVAQTWLVVDTAMGLTQVRHVAEQRLAKSKEIASARLDRVVKREGDARTALRQCQDVIYDFSEMARAESTARETAEWSLQQCREQWSAVDMPTVLCSQQAADIDDARLAAEQKFRVCLSANAGLVDALHEFDALVKEQQLVIQESLDLARRCDARPATWALRIPAVSEVRW